MEYWGPWSNLYRKSGGTIAGNVNITGTLTVAGVATLNDDTDINGQVIIRHDDLVGASNHLILRDATPAGNVQVMAFNDDVGNFHGAVASLTPTQIGLIPPINGEARMPCDALGGAPSWKVPNLADPLDARRMLMLHAIMFGM